MPKEPVKFSNLWTCPECKLLDGMEQPAFLDHIKTVHKITDTKGTKALSMALDGSGFYQNVYEWTIGGKTFYQTMTGPRGRSAMGD